MSLKDKIAIAVGAGQSPGEGLGNGRATVLRSLRKAQRYLPSTIISPPPRKRSLSRDNREENAS